MPKKPPRLDLADPVQGFAGELRRLRRGAGNPSLGRLEGTMACSHSTISAYLNGRRLPPPQQLKSFVLACDGNVTDWLNRLEAVWEELDRAPAADVQRRRRVYETPPSARGLSEPANSYDAAVLADQPIAYWQFNDTEGSLEYADSSGHDNTLPAGLTALARHGGPGNTGAITTVGGTFTSAPLSPLVGSAPRTVEAWFKTTSNGCILDAGSIRHSEDFSLCLMDGPYNSPAPYEPGFYLRTYDADIFAPLANMTDAHWHHLALTLANNVVAIVIDGAQPHAYIWNGSVYGSLTAQPFALPYAPSTGFNPLGVGTAGVCSGLVGSIAEVAVYPRALHVSELVRHYQLLASDNS
ncbi:MAG TPA: LamG-like jellyroll fold domain-containing protein [Streptosporangiaceae bacterium]|nr:LamG-like jellyroll fold domain-containing protein [Streptosporangiaceae bacterium]